MSIITISNSPLLVQQATSLFKSTTPGGLANIFSSLLVYTMVFGTHIQTYALYLTILISFFSIIRIAITKYYSYKISNISVVLSIYLFLTFAMGACWGTFSILQSLQDDEVIRNMVYLINFGLIAGSLVTLSVWIPAYLVYILPQSFGIFSVLVVQPSGTSIYFSAAFMVFILIMVSGGFRYYKEFIHMFMLQEELKDSRINLEKKVEYRTLELKNSNWKLRHEIEEKKKAKSELEYIAYHDELTGLPKKNLLVDRINTSIVSSNRNKNKIGILFLDLDRFKVINDTLGHTIGDKLILDVSKRLKETLREEDTISRCGGDEFVIVIKHIHIADEIIPVAKKIINTITKIFEIDSHQIHIGVSIGVSIYPYDGDAPLKLIKNADTAMFCAKSLGGNLYRFYDKSMSERLNERLHLENGLHFALENNEFYMVYQPQVNSTTNKTVGFEALIRWKNKDLGLIGPDLFIPLLEETGLIYEVGKWIVKDVIRYLGSGKTNNISISINLSPLQCRDLELVEYIKEQINYFKVDSKLIDFEITESLLIKDFELTEIFLNKLHEIGCTVTLDDFGTGYTSMSYLTRLPIDVIKVDQSFIRGIDKNATLKNIVRAIVNMSSSLGLKNVFEGVETKEELLVINELNGQVIQGYYYSKPIEENEVPEWLSMYTLKEV